LPPQARDELSNPRLNGGDIFQVLLVPRSTVKPNNQPRLLTAPAVPLAAGPDDTPSATLPHSTAGSSVDSFGSCSSSSRSGASVGLEAYMQRPAAPTSVVAAVAAGDVQDNGDGTYSVSYTHSSAGVFDLHVTNGGQC
jgi:hypothetical protein